jgi:hypothetical protein
MGEKERYFPLKTFIDWKGKKQAFCREFRPLPDVPPSAASIIFFHKHYQFFRLFGSRR